MLIIDRELHTSLNRLILHRLPLALPPHTDDPALYATGLLHFARIYTTFESAWETHSLSHSTLDIRCTDQRIFAILKKLFLPSLLRTARLRDDLSLLLKLSPNEIDAHLTVSSPISAYICQSITAKPHVIIAYAWVMYMAIFNGGRWIRTQLIAARGSSWTSYLQHERDETEPGGLGEAGLSFWHFDGSEDGEDIKSEFRLRVAGMEHQLEPQEWSDIVREAPRVFKLCSMVVKELDLVIAARQIRSSVVASFSSNFLLRYLPVSMADLLAAIISYLCLGRASEAAYLNLSRMPEAVKPKLT